MNDKRKESDCARLIPEVLGMKLSVARLAVGSIATRDLVRILASCIHLGLWVALLLSGPCMFPAASVIF